MKTPRTPTEIICDTILSLVVLIIVFGLVYGWGSCVSQALRADYDLLREEKQTQIENKRCLTCHENECSWEKK